MRQLLTRWCPVAGLPDTPIYDFAVESLECGKASLTCNYANIVGSDGRNLLLTFHEMLAFRVHWDGDAPMVGRYQDAPRCQGDRYIWPLLDVKNSEWLASGDFDTSRAIAEALNQAPWAQFSIVTLERSIDVIARGEISADWIAPT